MNKSTKINKTFSIGVDGNEANLEKRVGVNTYAFELLRSLSSLSAVTVGDVSITVYLKSVPLPHMPKASDNFKYKVIPGGSLWIIRYLMPYLFTKGRHHDCFWTPSHYIPPFAPMPIVCSIMDLGYLTFSEQFKKYDYWQLRLWTAWSLIMSRKIIAISDTTKNDIVRRYSFAREKVSTTLLGYDNKKFNTETNVEDVRLIKSKYSIRSKSYLLFVGMLKPSKNIEGLLSAWALIEKNYPDTSLVVAGRKGWLFESIFEKVKKLSLESRVVFTDFVDEIDKPPLIAGAKAFILPSFWEGFGLDVVSAMACGVPVIVSDRGSLPEVVGDAGVIVDPDSNKKISEGISKVLSATPKRYNTYVQSGLSRARLFSWQGAAEKTLTVLRSTH